MINPRESEPEKEQGGSKSSKESRGESSSHRQGHRQESGHGAQGAQSSRWAQQYEQGRQKTQVDLNKASEQDLEKLTGIGAERARALVGHRPFHSWEDVEKVPGFSEGMLEDLKNSGATIGKSKK